jgi:hypothetical protein
MLWAGSLFIPGLHRFYLGKIGTGLLWLFTGGLAGLGTIYDAFTLPNQVRDANVKLRMRGMLGDEYDDPDGIGYTGTRPIPAPGRPTETPEHAILRVAKSNHGLASPAEVALEGNMTTDEAQKQLDALVNKGIGEVRVRKSGSLVYVFPDFLDAEGSVDLEQY